MNNQRQRERTCFSIPNANNSQNPLKELDEIYAKDEKIAQLDLDDIAKDDLRKKEEEKFN